MSKRDATIWEKCHACAQQMVGGPRCWEHNPSPDDERPYVTNTHAVNPNEHTRDSQSGMR